MSLNAPSVKTKYTPITATTTVSKLAMENDKRKELIIINTSTANLYIHFSRIPNSTDYAMLIPSGGIMITESQDAINGVWASAASGQANITEEF